MADGDGLVKLSDQTWELNVIASLAELRTLRAVQHTDWAQRRRLRVGTCLGAPVWWNEEEDRVHILVGEDASLRTSATSASLNARAGCHEHVAAVLGGFDEERRWSIRRP